MREIRPYGSEGGGAVALPTPILVERALLRTLLEEKPFPHRSPYQGGRHFHPGGRSAACAAPLETTM